MHILSAYQLTKKYGLSTVVDKLNLDVKEGTIYGFPGLNAAGKTTTMRMLFGMINPTAGNHWYGRFEMSFSGKRYLLKL